MNIAFIPIDNRPVCYTLAKQIADINPGIKLFMPERKFLGGLTKISDTEAIFEFLENLKEIDAVVMCLDTVAYGGLIPSRRSTDSFEQIKNRIEKLKAILEKKQSKIYAFSSIMRISNNNVNQEEKEYWNFWGKKIFEYSYDFHKTCIEPQNDIPKKILDDYLTTRKRNFEINKLYLQWQKEGFFDTLVFSKDDCAEYGLNVKEAKELEALGGFVKTGADEIPLTLLARAINCEIKVAPIFLSPENKNLISNYEDISIEKSVNGQLELAGCRICEPEDADILLYINNFETRQGEIVMKIPTKPFEGDWNLPQKPYMIADVRFANGADNNFVEKIFENGIDENFYGYSAWNTSANTLGSLICAAKMRFASINFLPPYHSVSIHQQILRFAQNDRGYENRLLSETFLKLQAVRLLDDWAYQANVRQMLDKPDENLCKELMIPFEKKVFDFLKKEYNIKYKFPWERLFEVEIELN